MSALQYIGNSTFMTGSLASSYTSGGGSLSLTSGHGARFPSAGDFWVRADDEVFKVTARTGDTLTVTGAQDGTSASNHSAGATVRWVLSAAALTQLRADLIQTGAIGSIPSASSVPAGTIYLPTDSVYSIVRSDGSSWAYFRDGAQLTPVVNGDFSDHGSPTVSTTGGVVNISVSAGASDLIVGRKKSISGIASVTCRVLPHFITEDYHSAGLFVTDDTKILTWGIEGRATSGVRTNLISGDWTNDTTFSGDNVVLAFGFASGLFLRYAESGGNRILSASPDGINYTTYLTEANTTFLTATKIGMYVHRFNASRGTSATFIHWLQA